MSQPVWRVFTTSTPSVIGGAGDDVFIKGAMRNIFYGMDGFDVAFNEKCGIEHFECSGVAGDAGSSPMLLPTIIIVRGDSERTPGSALTPTVLINHFFWARLFPGADAWLFAQITYLYHLSGGPRFAPLAGDLVELPPGAGTHLHLEEVDLGHLQTQLASISRALQPHSHNLISTWVSTLPPTSVRRELSSSRPRGWQSSPVSRGWQFSTSL